MKKSSVISHQLTVNSGQSLFEVVFALAIAAIILVGIVSLATSSIRNTTFARNQSVATRYVQEGVEWLREQRDTDWGTFSPLASPGGTTYCLTDLASGLVLGICSAGDEIPGTPFTREIVLTELSVSIIQAHVSVEWTDAQGDHQASAITRLTNWLGGIACASLFNNPQPPGSTSALCQPDPPGGSPSSSCGSMGGATCCRYECAGGSSHWCERTGGSPGDCSGFMDCGPEC